MPPLPPSYDNVVYPNNIDTFRVVANGNTPDNIVDARLVNKVSNCIMSVERHTQYTCDTPTATGYYMLVGRAQFQLSSDLPDPGLLTSVSMPVSTQPANAFFGGSPFNRKNSIFVTGVGYHIVGSSRNYFPCRAAVNCGTELGNQTLNVDVVKVTDKWRAGDICEVNLMIVRLPT